jgi:predicted secreted protein
MWIRAALVLPCLLVIACGAAQTAQTAQTTAPAPTAEPRPPLAPIVIAPKEHLSVVCHPFCDEVLLGERSLGPSPVDKAEVAPGTHKLTIKRKGMPDKQVDAVVKAGEDATVRVDLAPSAAPPKAVASQVAARTASSEGWMTFLCTPGCDDVILDGKRSLGKGAQYVSIPAPEGTHQMTLKRAGVPDKTMPVNVIAGQTIAFKVSMEGYLEVPAGDAPPPGARPVPKEEVELRARLEPKVWGGKATLQEIKLLKSLCAQHGDLACRDRADAVLKTKL